MNSGAAAKLAHAEDGQAHAWRLSDYFIVPVMVHILKSATAPAANADLKDDDILRIVRKANTIWAAAGVQLRLVSIVHEEAQNVAGHELEAEISTNSLLDLRPPISIRPDRFEVYYIHSMAPNGIFEGVSGIFVKDTAVLRKVTGGIDEALPRVTAHELGHGMGLPHRQDTFNLMASGTTGTLLNESEIASVRLGLAHLNWVETPEACIREADAELKLGHKESARSRYKAITGLPGESSLKTQAAAALQKMG